MSIATASIGAEVRGSSPAELQAYLQGALKDGTYSQLHRTHRYCQRDRRWLVTIRSILSRLGHRGWIYREGAERDLFVCETSAPFLSCAYHPGELIGKPAALAYVRGYFDAEGGMPRASGARLYLQLSQKDEANLSMLRVTLEAAGINCARLHNPSARIDPAYWRLYVRAASHRAFMNMVGSWHPRKRASMCERLRT